MAALEAQLLAARDRCAAMTDTDEGRLSQALRTRHHQYRAALALTDEGRYEEAGAELLHKPLPSPGSHWGVHAALDNGRLHLLATMAHCWSQRRADLVAAYDALTAAKVAITLTLPSLTRDHPKAVEPFAVFLQCTHAMEAGLSSLGLAPPPAPAVHSSAVAAAAAVGGRDAGFPALLLWNNDWRKTVHTNAESWVWVLRVAGFLHSLGQRVPGAKAVVSANQLETLRLAVARVARKQSNTELAARLLAQAPTASIHHQYEQSKMFHLRSQHNDAINHLAATVLQHVPTAMDHVLSPPGKGPVHARMLVRLADWAQEENAPLADHFAAYQAIVVADASHASPNVPTFPGDGGGEFTDTYLAGRCLHLACSHAPGFAKARLRYAAWCYRQGRRAVADDAVQQRLTLTEGELGHIMALVAQWRMLPQQQRRHAAIPPGTVDPAVSTVIALFADSQAASAQDRPADIEEEVWWACFPTLALATRACTTPPSPLPGQSLRLAPVRTSN